MEKAIVQEIPKTKGERDAWYGSAPEISDDILAELTIQAKGYSEHGLKKCQKMAMSALKDFGADRAYCIPLTQEMVEAGDFGFRLKENEPA